MLTPQDGLLSYMLPTRTAHAGRASVSCAKVSACNLLAKMGFCAAQEPDQMLQGRGKTTMKSLLRPEQSVNPQSEPYSTSVSPLNLKKMTLRIATGARLSF
jgi:hypothetical protein